MIIRRSIAASPSRKRQTRAARTLHQGVCACFCCCCGHLTNPSSVSKSSSPDFLPSSPRFCWQFQFGNIRLHDTTNGSAERRSGGHRARWKINEFSPVSSIRDAVDDKTTAGRLPLPVNALVVLGHQRRRPSKCDGFLEVDVRLHAPEDNHIHANVVNFALLQA